MLLRKQNTRGMADFWREVITLAFGVLLFAGPSLSQGQSGFYFGQPDNRFVPSFQSQAGGPYFSQNNFNSQFRPSDFSQQQVFNTQGSQSFQDSSYEQNRPASQFQIPPGRNRQNGQYFVQSDFAPISQGDTGSFPVRGNAPTSYQISHPASTNRPEFSPFSQTSHNHDPSKPEIFLGQITINNPDPFPDNPGDVHSFNSPRIRKPGQNNYNTNILRSPGLDFDSDFPSAAGPVDQDIYEYTDKPKITTYSPSKPKNKPQSRIVHNSRPSYFNSPKHDDFEIRKPQSGSNENYFSSNENSFSNSRNRFKPKGTSTTSPAPPTERQNRFSPSTKNPGRGMAFNIRSNKPSFSPNKPHYSSTTEHKPLFDIAPLLEDEIPENSYGDSLHHATNGSEDVEVIKSVETTTDKPTTEKEAVKEAKAMKNLKEESTTQFSTIEDSEHSENVRNETITEFATEIYEEQTENEDNANDPENIVESHKNIQTSEAPEYYDEEVEYIDETEEPDVSKHGDTSSQDPYDDQNEEYDEVEEVRKEDDKSTVKSETFEILTMKPKQTMVKDDNFKEFVDSALIDNTEPPSYVTEEYAEPDSPSTTDNSEENTTDPPSILIGEEVVSVVTTKSVVNGTFSVPEITKLPPKSTVEMNESADKSEVSTKSLEDSDNKDENITTVSPNSTESWVVVASVQTSRSVSGARFLPFPGVAQDEKKQALSDLDEREDEEPTMNPEDATVENVTPADVYVTDTNTKSTESIIDKLDEIQSRLSNGFLSGGFKGGKQDFAVLKEMQHESNSTKEETEVTSAAPLQIFTVKSTTTTTSTERGTPEPIAVTIKKFSPYSRPATTTPKPKSKVPSFETIKMDDLTGLLPAGFKVRSSYKDRKITTTTEKSEEKQNNSGNVHKKIVFQDDIASLLPKGYKPPKEEKQPSIEDLFKNIKTDSIAHLLPPGFKLTPEVNDTTTVKTKSLLDKADPVDISSFLPKGFKPMGTSTEKTKTTSKILEIAKPVDVSAFLPPGFKLDPKSKEASNTTLPVKIADISSLLPPGFKLGKDTAKTEASTQSTTSVGTSPKSTVKPAITLRIPGAGRPGKRLTTPNPSNKVGMVGGSTSPTLRTWPTRATTEFTGWPTPSTTPFSIEKLLEAQRAAAAAAAAKPEVASSSEAPETTTTASTTTPTTTTQQPTTPGICTGDCDLAATIKIVGGVKWVPELLDHNTKEWQILANEVSSELDSVYSKSPSLKKWYKGIRIDGFSKGSVLVDYFVELNQVSSKVDTMELKKLFHTSLTDARPGSVIEEVPVDPDRLTGRKIGSFDPDMMLGDQPPEERLETVRKLDRSGGKLEIGKFVLDPVFTEFIVLPKRLDPTVGFAEDNNLLPQWGIAVIVIALASLLFVVIFGVTVLVNRQKNSKAKQPIPLSEDMLRELDKSHMGTDLYLQEQEPPYHKVRSNKRGSAAMLDPLGYPGNPGDSWRSEWGPYYSQYSTALQQHYAPDSGRGSQSYTPNGNYGYSGSQNYGYNGGGGGSQNYGYSGEGVRTLYPRRRSDFDSTF